MEQNALITSHEGRNEQMNNKNREALVSLCKHCSWHWLLTRKLYFLLFKRQLSHIFGSR